MINYESVLYTENRGNRYASAILFKSPCNRFWTDSDNFHRFIMDDYGDLVYVEWNDEFSR